MGFRQNATTGVAVDDEPETIYMVTSGTHYNTECCAPPAACCPAAAAVAALLPALLLLLWWP